MHHLQEGVEWVDGVGGRKLRPCAQLGNSQSTTHPPNPTRLHPGVHNELELGGGRGGALAQHLLLLPLELVHLLQRLQSSAGGWMEGGRGEGVSTCACCSPPTRCSTFSQEGIRGEWLSARRPPTAPGQTCAPVLLPPSPA